MESDEIEITNGEMKMNEMDDMNDKNEEGNVMTRWR